MLKNIPYEPTNADINVLEDLKTTVLNCLNKIGLPTTYYLNICTSIFATGMNDRGTGLQYEPLSQCYKYPRDWQNSPSRTVVGVEPTSTYISCYDVLQKIALGWGCQIKQSGGEYYFASISEQAGATIYYTRVDNTGSLISYGSLDPKRTIAHYSTSNNIYWIDNKQTKILRKGFPDLQLTCPAAYAPQFIYGGTMASFTGSTGNRVPDHWTFTPSTGNVTATCDENTYGFYTGAELFAGTNYCDLIANCPVLLWAGKINLSFVLKPLTYIASTPGCQVEIKIDVGGGHHWKYKKDAGLTDAVWVYDYVDGFYNVDVSSNELTNQTITTTDIPTQGTLSIKFRVQNATTSSGAFIAYAVMTITDPYDYRLIKNTTSNPAYRKVIELPIGGPSEYRNYSQIASLLKSDGTQWIEWYRYGVTESRDDLMRLVYQNYFNIMSKSSINMNGNIWGLFISGIRPTQPFTSFNVTDTGGKMSVSGKSYLIGNSTFDYIDNTVSATLLETSDTDISATITDEVILKL
jgi:hypothetical protein